MKPSITTNIARVIAEHGPMTKQQMTHHLPGLQQSSVGYMLRSEYTYIFQSIQTSSRGYRQTYDLTPRGRKLAMAADKTTPKPPKIRQVHAAVARCQRPPRAAQPEPEVLFTSATIFTQVPLTLPQTFYTPPRLFIRAGAMAALQIRSRGISA